MAKIYVTRHGETEWNTQRRMQGHLDSALTETGITQAKWLGEAFKHINIAKIYASPSGRASETAKLIRGQKKLEIQPLEALKEIYLGSWESKTQVEIEAYAAENYNAFWHSPEKYVPEDRESFESVIQRASSVLEAMAENESEDVLLVTHAVLLKSMYAYIYQKQLSDFWTGPFMNATCLNCFEKVDGQWRVLIEADTSHYQTEVINHWANPK